MVGRVCAVLVPEDGEKVSVNDSMLMSMLGIEPVLMIMRRMKVERRQKESGKYQSRANNHSAREVL